MSNEQQFTNEFNIFSSADSKVENFIQEYPESRTLTMEEVKMLKTLGIIAKHFGFSHNLVLSPGLVSNVNCIFKLENGTWITWSKDDRDYFYRPTQSENAKDACYRIIEICLSGTEIDKKLVITTFDELLKREIPNLELVNFAKNWKYTIIPSKAKKLIP